MVRGANEDALASSECRRPRGQSASWGGRDLLLLLRRVELLRPVGGHLRAGRVDVVDAAREAALARGRLHALDVDVARRAERLLADAQLLPARLFRGGLGLEDWCCSKEVAAFSLMVGGKAAVY